GESAESRAATICAGLAAGLLSELSVLHPELFPKNPPQDSDLMILRDYFQDIDFSFKRSELDDTKGSKAQDEEK
ncbi:MAG: hypothetical protein GY915_04320, partial [bacterium]|nr:hypothetical protein [bacterium]